MRIADRGSSSAERVSGDEEPPLVLHSLNPQSSILDPEVQFPDPVYMERVRWRCRRGLLELDIVLGRFIEQRYAGLDEMQQAAFDALLDMPDTVLWDMITGRELPAQESQRTVLEWLKSV